MNVKNLSWSQLDNKLNRLKANIEKKITPDIIVGVARNGLIMAAMLSLKLNVQSMHSVRIKHYGEGKPPKHKWEHPEILQHLKLDLNGKIVLVVDDMVREGTTLKLAKDHMFERGAQEVFTAVLIQDPRAKFKPDFSVFSSKSCHIFPWEI